MSDSELPELRISDAEREQAMQDLGEHMTVGRIDVVEFDERAAKIAAARTRSALVEVFTDLPEPRPKLDGSPSERTPATTTSGAVAPLEHRTTAMRLAAALCAAGLAAWIPLMIFAGWWWFFFIPLALSGVFSALWGKGWDGRDHGREPAQELEERLDQRVEHRRDQLESRQEWHQRVQRDRMERRSSHLQHRRDRRDRRDRRRDR